MYFTELSYYNTVYNNIVTANIGVNTLNKNVLNTYDCYLSAYSLIPHEKHGEPAKYRRDTQLVRLALSVIPLALYYCVKNLVICLQSLSQKEALFLAFNMFIILTTFLKWSFFKIFYV